MNDQPTLISSAASEDSPSQRNGQDSGPSPSAKSTTTAGKCSPKTFCADAEGTGQLRRQRSQNDNQCERETRTKRTDARTDRYARSNTNLRKHLRPRRNPASEASTSSQVDFLASLSVLPGSDGGAADDRAIWPEMFRVISEARPAWVLGENVPGIIPMELDNVLSDLEGIGYATRAFVIPACAVDARHRRDRVWIIGRNTANSKSTRLEGFGTDTRQPEISESWNDSTLADTPGEGANRHRSRTLAQYSDSGVSGEYCRWQDESEWFAKSGMGRISHGVRNRVDRLKGLGNAIVPQVAYEILREIRKQIR